MPAVRHARGRPRVRRRGASWHLPGRTLALPGRTLALPGRTLALALQAADLAEPDRWPWPAGLWLRPARLAGLAAAVALTVLLRAALVATV